MGRSYPEIFVNGRTWDAGGLDRPAKLPARTAVDFSKLKIASRLLIGLILLASAAFLTLFAFSNDKGFTSVWFLGPVFVALLGLWFTAVSAYHLFVRKPLLSIDVAGLDSLKHGPIAWSEVSSLQIRVTPSSRGPSYEFLKVTPNGKRAPFEIEITQSTTDPVRLVRILEAYVAAYREANGLPTGSGKSSKILL